MKQQNINEMLCELWLHKKEIWKLNYDCENKAAAPDLVAMRNKTVAKQSGIWISVDVLIVLNIYGKKEAKKHTNLHET